MWKRFLTYIKETIQEEYKFIIFLILLYIIFQYPVNYYVIVGGGISNVNSRIKVDNSYSSKGSFNISYVTQLEGTLLSYGLSYLIPSWERESADNYKYDTNESIKDIEFRSDLDLKVANSTATYWAYHLANKKVNEDSSKLYVIAVFSPDKTSLKVQDQILNVDGHAFDNVLEYRDYFQTKKDGDVVSIKIIRNNKEKIISSKLYENDGRILLGVGLQFLKTYQVTPEVKIQFKKSESGPSGGLITTLEIYNQLTKKDLTCGKKIAGTGTIEEDGSIGTIGGVEHKLLGANHDKAAYFLVPSGQNYKDALKYKKSKKMKIKLIEVKNIEEAIKKLEDLE